MARPRVAAGGGLAAVYYVLQKGRESGGLLRLYRRMRSRNACKTCALGMGGQLGGMVNEARRFPEVCKKAIQAQAGDMASAITEGFFRNTPLASLERLTSAELERLGRLAFPVMAEEGDTHFRRISWDQALERTAAAVKTAPPEEVFFYSSGRSSNEAAFLMQLVARAYGTANIHNCSFYCHNASSVALGQVYGSGTASITLEDLGEADLALVAGANPASNHPRLVTQLMELRRRGGKVIVVNPLRELGLVRFRVPSDWRSMLFGSTVSDLYLQPHVGADVALLKALLKGVVESGGLDRAFIEARTTGWAGVEADLTATSWDTLVGAAGVPRAEIERAVEMLLGARRGIFLWAMGLTHHANGVDNVLALANLALARGWLGRAGCGLLPIRGHSNVQGVGSCGVTPSLKQAFQEKLEALYGIRVPANPGQDTYGSMVAAAEGRVRGALLLGGNLFASTPDRRWAGAALRRIGLTCSITTKLNEGHVHGRGRTAILVPVLARDEEAQATTQESMFNFVRLSEGGTPAIAGEMRSEVEVIAALAERILPAGRYDWSALRSHRRLREEIAKVVPGYGAIAEVDRTRREFHVGGRTFHDGCFATADGHARFHVTALPEFAPSPEEFRLMTLRSEGQFNTVVYEEEDLYRGNRRRDVVMMAAEDAGRLGVGEGDRVLVETETGQLEVSAAIVTIRPGNLAMYYPEANVLVPRRLDARSKTPAFKSVAARLRRAAALILLTFLAARPVAAHIVPVLPSTCTFDPIEVTPDAGPAPLVVAPPGAEDAFRIRWDTGASLAQFDLGTVPPRAVSSGTTQGTLAFPALFQAEVLASGDLRTPPATITLALDDSPPTPVTAAFTTGVVGSAGGRVLEGTPLGADGRFTLVGLDLVAGQSVRLGCQAAPPPDLDQFRIAPETARLTGVVRMRCRPGQDCRPESTLGAVFTISDGVAPDFTRPATLRVSVGGETVAMAHFPHGLIPSGSSFVATGDHGTLSVRPRRLRPAPRYALKATGLFLPSTMNPPPTGTVQVTFEVGGLVSRASRPFRYRENDRGSRLRIRGQHP